MSQESQFLEAFEAHAQDLFRHASFRVRDREKAKDLVQDVFTRTWDYIVQGKTIDQFRPFLYRTLNNMIVDQYRRSHNDFSLDALLEEDGVSEFDFDELRSGGREEQEFQLDAKELHRTLGRLPEHYRQVLVLRYIDGFEPREIAELVAENTNVISVRIHRALAMLRKEFYRTKNQ